MKSQIYKKQNKRGFTVIELIVSVALFSIILIAITGSLLSVIKVNRQASLVKNVMNNLDFALEGMVRSVRSGSDYDCGTVGGHKNCESTPSSMFSFKPQGSSQRISYTLSNGQIMKKVGNEDYSPITSPDITVNRLNFYVSGVGSRYVQPAVIFVVSGEASYKGNKTVFNVESLAVQRLFNK